MKDIRLCDDSELEMISKLCEKNNMGIEVQIKVMYMRLFYI